MKPNRVAFWGIAGRWALSIAALAAVLWPAAAGAQVQLPIASTFDERTEGWALAAGELGTITHTATGGSPGGYLRFTDAVGASSGHVVAPPRFHGDWSALDGVASLSWQHRIIDPGGGPTISQLVAYISGPGGTARFDSGVLGQVGVWVAASAPLVSSSWVVESGSWAAILADVNEVRVRIEVVSNAAAGTEIAGIDNVVLDDALAQPVSLPQHTSFVQSLEGWALAPGEIGSVTFVGSGGNPGGYARFDDGVGSSPGHLVAPASWRGSWLGPDGPGLLEWSHVVLDPGELPTIGTLQAKLSGPGGSAVYDSGVLASTAGWITIQAPIEEAAWTVTAGSWNALLANVTDLRIVAEAVSNGGAGDTDGLDEISLRRAAPVPGPPAWLLAWALIGAGVRALRGRAAPR